jgi:DNA-binding SARP family transcriptional activator
LQVTAGPLQVRCKRPASRRGLRALEGKVAVGTLTVAVLGILEVRHGSTGTRGRPLPRRLLALLAAQPDGNVPLEALIDELWGDEPPSAAKATPQSRVVRLRVCMPRPQVISAAPSAYRLVVAPADVDASAFAIATEVGPRLLAAGHPRQAAACNKAGLDLWRGPAYAEFGGCRWMPRPRGWT